MSTTRLLTGVLVLGLVALLSGYGLAAERAPATDTSSFGDANAAAPPMADAACAGLVRASRVMHSRIEGSDGRTLGTVHDIVLTPDLKSVSYVVLSRPGVLGLGGSLYAIPWTAVRQNVNGTFTVPITEAQLKQSRGFRPGHWPTSATLQGPVYQDEMASENKSIQQRRFSRVKGMNAKGSDGVKAGDVRDLVIVMDTGQVAYTILSSGGILGLGSRYAAVPENAITFEPAIRVARVDATKATVQANSFTPGRWPDLASPAYSEQVARIYGVAPVGTALAFVPPEGTTAVARAPRTTTPSARSTTPPVSGTTPAPMGEPTPAELTGTFNPSSITTIDGTVVAEGRFQPTSGSEMLWLRVRPETGQPVLVNLGPRSYISAQDFYVVPGDRIHLTGSKVAATASGKQVFLPTEVTYEGHTLRLRSATGAPLWEGQTGTTATPPLGYAPAEEPATAPGRSATTPSAPTPAEPTPEELTGTFNASAITSVDGTVLDEGKFRAPAANQDMLWLRVRTTDGRTLLVNLGPRDYVSQQNFYIVRGDQIHLKGSEVATKAAGRRVFLPTEVMYNNHMLRLRSATGTPLWEGQAAGAATPPLGYAPAESQTTRGTSAAAGQAATQFTPAQIINATALDLSNSRTIEGTVIEVGKSGTSTPAAGAASSSQAASSGSEVIWLRVRTADGQIFNVQLGPRDYLSRQNFFVVNGDRVRLTGWNARSTAAAGATTVFVPADITVMNGPTLQLRNRNGEPLWTAQAGMAGQMPGMQMPSEQTTTPGAAGTSQATRRPAMEPNEPNKP